MDTEHEIWRLAGEAIATQQILTGLCIGLSQSGDVGRAIVAHAFDYAEAAADSAALTLGGDQPQTHLSAVLNVTSELRKAVLGDDGGPKGAV